MLEEKSKACAALPLNCCVNNNTDFFEKIG